MMENFLWFIFGAFCFALVNQWVYGEVLISVTESLKKIREILEMMR